MKRLLEAAVLSLLLLSCTKGGDSLFVRVSSENPHYFELSDGSCFIPIGPNICFDRFETDEQKVLSLYEDRFRKLSENGGNYARIWLGYPFFELERNAVGEYDETSVRRIDAVLELAARYNLRLKFCIEYFRHIADPASYPGEVPFFDKPVYGTYFKDMDEYCKTDKGQEVFLNKMRFLSDRYADNPAVFGWELWNEVNCLQVSDGIEGCITWTAGMLPKVQEMFPNHLVMQSMGSFDKTAYRDWYNRFVNLPDNDVAQVHRYLDPGAEWDICQASIDTLSSEAVAEIRSMIADKPVVLAETGAVKWRHSGPSELYEKDTLGVLLHDAIFAPFFSGAAATGQSWHWEYYIDKNDLWWHYSRFAKAIEGVDPIKEKFEPFFFLQDDVRFYGLKGASMTLIWARDRRSNYQTELVDRVQPSERTISLNPGDIRPGAQKASVYDPWTDRISEVSASEPADITFTRSFVIRIN